MRARRRLTVRKRLFAIAVIGALLTSVVGAVGLSGYARLTGASRAESRLATIQTLTLTSQSMQHQVRAQAWFAVAISAGETGRPVSEVRSEFEAARTELRASNERLTTLADGGGYEQEIRAIGVSHDALLIRADTVIRLSATDRPAALDGIGVLEEGADALDERITALIDTISADRAAHLAAADRIKDVDTQRLLAAALLAALLVLGLSARLTRSILRDLRSVDDVARRIGAGELDARVDKPRDDEIGALARSFNDTAARLSATMHQLTAEARREKLGGQLADAFDMAETEPDAYEVIANTLAVLAPDRAGELLLADNSEARLTTRATGRTAEAPCCPVTSPFHCVAVRRGHAVTFADSEALDACPKLRNRPQGRVSAVCVPVTFMGRSLGVLHTTGVADQVPAPETMAGLSLLGTQAGNRIGTLRSFELAQMQASTDGLTGLPNRRAFETEVRERLRTGARLAFVMADLDRFKMLNDTHGHEAGDRALRLFGRVLRSALGKDDLVGRLGGEEFGIVLAGVTLEQAVTVLHRLRVTLAEAIDGGTPPFTASFGVCGNDGHASFDELLRVADKALYQAKHEGRDRVVTAGAVVRAVADSPAG
jgi:diguanylate cyclase (GGDEF)-like protein